jgi:hypothetical protein
MMSWHDNDALEPRDYLIHENVGYTKPFLTAACGVKRDVSSAKPDDPDITSFRVSVDCPDCLAAREVLKLFKHHAAETINAEADRIVAITLANQGLLPKGGE